MLNNDTTFQAVEALERKPRSSVGRLYKVWTDENGKLQKTCLLKVVFSRPKDWGTGVWAVGMSDYRDYPSTHAIGTGRGCGQDMFANVTQGMRALGVEFGDHADYMGRPTFRDFLSDLLNNEHDGGRTCYVWGGDFHP